MLANELFDRAGDDAYSRRSAHGAARAGAPCGLPRCQGV